LWTNNQPSAVWAGSIPQTRSIPNKAIASAFAFITGKSVIGVKALDHVPPGNDDVVPLMPSGAPQMPNQMAGYCSACMANVFRFNDRHAKSALPARK
jgi:hypothetical protein